MTVRPGKSALIALVVATVSLAAFAASALAAADVEIRSVDTNGFPRLRLTIVSSTPVARAPLVDENSKPVAGLEAENLGREKAVLLALDRSQSMKGASLSDALRAARKFVDLSGDADRLSLVSFASRAEPAISFSSTPSELKAELSGIGVDSEQGTALYDAVVIAVRALAKQPLKGRVLILLTDGADRSSRHTLEDAIAVAKKADIAVYTVGIKGSQFEPEPLQMLATETGGSFASATTSSDLSEIYTAIASELSRTWLVSYLTAARPGDEIDLSARLIGVGSVTKTVKLDIPGAPANGSGSLLPSFAFSLAGTGLIALVAGLLGLAALIAAASTRKASWVRSRLAPHLGETSRARAVGTRERLSAVAALFHVTESAFGRLNVWKRLTRMLERANLPLRTVELVWLIVGVGLGLGFVVSLVGFGSLVVLAVMVVGGAIPYLVVWMKMKRRLALFESQLPDLLVTMAASLKAGHSFKQGLQAVVDEGQEPASGEFRRVLTETSLGRPMDEALLEMSERLGSPNFEFVITAVTIQRQVGGSLAQLFDMVADTVRQRQQFQRKVKSLTAMGRMSAYVLVGLPFFLAFFLTMINPDYMAPLFNTRAGNTMIGVGLASIAFGSLMLRKVVSFKG
jgi:tight adherence protein B